MTHPALAIWERLTASAVLGTARGPTPELRTETPEALSQQLERAAVPDPDGRLLRWAALLSPYVRAGIRPRSIKDAPRDEASEDGRAACSARAAGHLEAILFGQYADLLDEWCQVAAEGGVRVREELLPPLLDHLVNLARAYGVDVIGRPLSVLGARGSWLASRHPTWRTLVTGANAEPEEMWNTGSRQERVAAVLQMRRADAVAARELLAKSFSEETPDDRVSFVEALAVGLSLADEPFLEGALDDRRKSVRAAAAELLYRLPQSRLAKRMQERALGLVTVERGRGKLEVTLPEALDDAMARDGIDAKRFPHLGDRARLLSQIIGAAPLSTWADDAKNVVDAFVHTDFAAALLIGLALAAGRQEHAAFAEAVLDCIVELSTVELDAYARTIPDLLAALPDDHYRAFIQRLVDDNLHAPALPLVLAAGERPFDVMLSRSVLAALCARARRGMPAIEWQLASAFKGTLARRLHPSVHIEALQAWPIEAEAWTVRDTDVVETLAATLAFRFEMLEELKERRP